MSGRTPTLLLQANGFRWHHILNDTLTLGVLGLRRGIVLPSPLRRFRLLDRAISQRDRYAALGYVGDWVEAFREDPRLAVDECNINDLVDFRRHRRAIAECPLVVVMHSALGDSAAILSRTANWFQGRRGKLIVFVGNEYDLMPQKLAFLRESGADYVCSQLPAVAAAWLYAGLPARVLSAPHACNPRVYRATTPPEQRTTDIGFVGSLYPWFIGDTERNDLVSWFRDQGAAHGLRCDIRTETVPRDEWVVLLNSFRGLIGAEAGTYYLERTGDTIRAVRSWLRSHPEATFGEVHQRFFAGRSPAISGKAISSRHFEAVGTRTCQLLVEGEYNGILKAGEHYIPVRRDLADVGEALRRFRDEGERRRIVAAAHAWVAAAHTYRHRVSAILAAVGLPPRP